MSNLFFSSRIMIVWIKNIFIEGEFHEKISTCCLFIFIIIPYYVFNKFFKTYTPEGNKLFDEIQGFKMFLNATEKDRLAMTSAPERTPQQYERFLPFAIALGVEKNWTKQFAPIFEQLKREGKPYQPNWYLGSNFQTIHLSRSFGTLFRSTLMKSSIRPGSFSSFGGRGSSGSGGGGGGGGGC